MDFRTDTRKLLERFRRHAGTGGTGFRGLASVDEEPLRAELLSIDQLRRYAQELAHSDEVDAGPGYNQLLPRLTDNTAALRAAHEVLVQSDAEGRRMAPPAEWLLDNFYLIEQQIQLARIHLPRRYSRQLPRLAKGPMQGLPRVVPGKPIVIA